MPSTIITVQTHSGGSRGSCTQASAPSVSAAAAPLPSKGDGESWTAMGPACRYRRQLAYRDFPRKRVSAGRYRDGN